jgi:glycosyltransferase involved in cell wall biosynthesis
VLHRQAIFESLGVPCQVVDWNDVATCKHLLSLSSLVIFYRVPESPKSLEIFEEVQRLGLEAYWEVDDLVFDSELLQTNHNIGSLTSSARSHLIRGAQQYRNMMLRFERGIASTVDLAHAMRAAGLKEVRVIENAISPEMFDLATQVQKLDQNQDECVRIVYGSGTNTHNLDFAQAEEALLTVLKRYKHVHLRIIGTLTLSRKFNQFSNQIERFPLCSFEDYLRSVAECEICIAPLEPSVFNDAKSNIKFLEAALLSKPSVCSPRSAFAAVVADRANGFLCETPQQWCHALSSLIEDSVYRARIGGAAHSLVKERYCFSHIAQTQLAQLLPKSAMASKKRVLVVNIYYAPRSFGGATIVAEQVSSRLQESDEYEMFVFTSLPEGIAESYALRRYEHRGASVFGVVLPRINAAGNDFEDPRVGEQFEQVLAAVKPDLVHFHSIQGLGVEMVAFCTEHSIPYIVSLHDSWWLCGRHFMLNRERVFCGQHTVDHRICASCVDNAALNERRRNVLYQILHGAHLLLSPSRYTAELYIANGFSKPGVVVHSNGIQRPRLSKKFRKAGPPVFAFVGGQSNEKGANLVQKVFAKPEFQDIPLLIVDNAMALLPKGKPEVGKQTQGVRESVSAYTQQSIDGFFDRVDVLLHPSQVKESFGLVVREALARNVWVITTDAGAASEPVIDGKNGLIVPFDDAGELLEEAVRKTLAHFYSIPAETEVDLPAVSAVRTFNDQAAELSQIYSSILDPTRDTMCAQHSV